MKFSKVLVYDMETTGFTAGTDEILQLSIVDGNGKELFNHLIKPTHTDDWSKAAEINGITKDKVADCETIAYWLPKLKALFTSADLLVGYNQLGFDNRFLQVLGIETSIKPSVDCMLAFSEKIGTPNAYTKGFNRTPFKWYKLEQAVEHYGYDWGADHAHDSLADAKATAFLWRSLNAD